MYPHTTDLECDETMAPEDRYTPLKRIRVPDALWTAYGNVVKRTGRTRTAALVEHMRRVVAEEGADEDRALLAAADEELAERRSRTGGRPPKRARPVTPPPPTGD